MKTLDFWILGKDFFDIHTFVDNITFHTSHMLINDIFHVIYAWFYFHVIITTNDKGFRSVNSITNFNQLYLSLDVILQSGLLEVLRLSWG